MTDSKNKLWLKTLETKLKKASITQCAINRVEMNSKQAMNLLKLLFMAKSLNCGDKQLNKIQFCPSDMCT